MVGEHKQDIYVEPKISYYIRAIVRYYINKLSNVQTLKAWRKILFTPIAEIQPPTNIRDFPAKFIKSLIQNFHTSLFRGPIFIITLTMTKPSAVKVKDMHISGSTLTELNVSVNPAKGKAHVDKDQ
jgi:fructose-1,6-bisphosphatase